MSDVLPTGTPTPLEPTRDPQVTLPDLLEVLLNKGVYLNLDLIITVADIPLIGVNLRATIAGIETMLEYGMMRSWDEKTRAWVRNSLSRQLPLADGEDIVARMAGGHYQDDDFSKVWRPGTVYLTSHRLVVFRRDPRAILWQARLDDIEGIELRTERSIGGEDRLRLVVTTADGAQTLLSAAAPERLRDLTLAQGVRATDRPRILPAEQSRPLVQGRVWYLEDRAGGALWRGGTGRIDRTDGVVWKGAIDARPAVRLRPDAIESVRVERGRTPLGDDHVLVITSARGATRLATEDLSAWLRQLDTLVPGTLHVPAATAGSP